MTYSRGLVPSGPVKLLVIGGKHGRLDVTSALLHILYAFTPK
jgi:hypothetical protein